MEANNNAKLREALEGLLKRLDGWKDLMEHYGLDGYYKLAYEQDFAELDMLIIAARAALSAPPRNCDVGTAEEQIRRIRSHCKQHKVGLRCVNCPVNGVFPKDCALIWAQLPYEKGETDGRK